MSRMIFDLTEEDRATLEQHRIRLGCRSHAETLRALIRGEDPIPALVAPSRPGLRGAKAVVITAKRPRTVKPVASRLKGEWKAP